MKKKTAVKPTAVSIEKRPFALSDFAISRKVTYLLLWRFFLSFFLRLCVAIFARFLFLPQG
ncbi:MAG: hypothetical protein KBS64_00410, partial [Treponema sp.]|nr:hypothetical protein [Candidatus Treponema equi]